MVVSLWVLNSWAVSLTAEVAQRIADRLYISLGDATVSRFSDGEVAVQINENVRGSDVFIIFERTYSIPCFSFV